MFHAHRAQDLDHLSRRLLHLAPGAIDEKHERRGRAIQHRHFGAIDGDDGIVDPRAGQRGHHMFHGAHRGVRIIGVGDLGA